MNDDAETRKAFVDLIQGLCDLRKRTPLTKGALTLYFNVMKPYSIEQVIFAAQAHLADPERGNFFPLPADLIAQLKKNEPPEISPLERAKLAWMEVEAEMRRTGPYQSLNLDDKVALAAVRNIGGWKHLCSLDNDKLVWKRKEFLDVYPCFLRTHPDALPQKLEGLADLRRAIDKPRLAAANDEKPERLSDGRTRS